MKVAIFSPFALPELGANVLRVKSFKKYFDSDGIETIVYSPMREGVSNKNTPKGYERYNKARDIFNVFSKTKFDVVIGTSPPLTHSFFALIAAKIHGADFVLDIRDPWTHSYEGLGIYSKTNPKLWIYKLMEIVAYNLSDRIFVVTKGIEKIVSKQTFNKKKISVIWNGTDTSLFRRDRKKGERVRESLGIGKNAVVLLYAGAFEKKDVEPMIENLAHVIRNANSFLLVVSPFPKEEKMAKLKLLSEKLGIGNKAIFVDSSKFGFEKLYEYYSAADIGLDPLPKGMDDYCIPVKTYDYFACEIPVLVKGSQKGSLYELVQKEGIGWVCDNWTDFSANAKKAIESKDLKKIGLKARKAAEEVFDRKFANEKALKEIKELSK